MDMFTTAITTQNQYNKQIICLWQPTKPSFSPNLNPPVSAITNGRSEIITTTAPEISSDLPVAGETI
ncbi:MAG: hypothetical protein B6U72_06750 [Candidatus Altiarchaeales archaeon ex4484_2]|nr:MAG: hypothetical protein B6U72_06750 [Candidatus Altiarchaeales archaeon ex4484_2]